MPRSLAPSLAAYQNQMRIIAKLLPTELTKMVHAFHLNGCDAMRELDLVNAYLVRLFSSWVECDLALRQSALNLAGAHVNVEWLVRKGAPGLDGDAQLKPLNQVLHPTLHPHTQ